jgi:hypothetical protein
MATAAKIDTAANGVGSRLEALFSRLLIEGVEIGIRERVIASRIAAEIAIEQQTELTAERWAFLLRARLTPALAKSPEDVARVRRAFLDFFPEEDRTRHGRPVRPDRPGPVLPDRNRRERFRIVALVAALIALAVVGVLVGWILSSPVQQVTQMPTSTAPSQQQTSRQLKTNTAAPANPLTADELGALARQIIAAAGNSREVSISELAARLAGAVPTGADARGMISLLQRYLPRAAEERFTLTTLELTFFVKALATRQFPGRTAAADTLSAAVASAGLDQLVDDESRGGPGQITIPLPAETLVTPAWLTACLVAVPGIPFVWWILGRRGRLKDYLRRRRPERPPLIHELLVHASADIACERTTLTRAALRLGRSRQGLSRTIDAEATALATARAAGFPHVVFAPARTSPEYLVLISTKGPEDHAARHLDKLVADLAAQNLALTRYFIAHDANLCFDSPDGTYFNLDQLAARYADHRLIFFGTGDQLLNPGTLAAWPWAEELTSWRRRAILTSKPIKEWGQQEVELAWLFDAPPLRADVNGLLRLAELFERQAPSGAEHFEVRRGPIRWSWTSRPQRWLIPLPPNDSAFKQLEGELARYFVDDRGNFDEDAFWWFAACAIYPALRWDLTVYLGLKLTSPRAGGGLPLYTEERALRLAVLPWFRDGYMPNWLRRRMLALLPKDMRIRAVALVRDIFERAVKSEGQAFDAVRLRIAQDRPDPISARPERDEIFLDALAGSDPLALAAPRSLRQLISGAKNGFVLREWTVLALIAVYWSAVALLVPGPSSGALTTAQWLPLVFLPFVLVTLPAARRISRWANDRADGTAQPASAAKD